MASLKDLKVRIASVKSTQKITKAMKMVAASKLKRAQSKAEATRPYSQKITHIITNLINSIDSSSTPQLLTGRKDEMGNPVRKTCLFIATSSDRGLCGGFNANLIKNAKKRFDELKLEGTDVKFITIGKKAKEIFNNQFGDRVLASYVACQGKSVTYKEAEEIGKFVIKLFERGDIDACELVYAKFINALTQKNTVKSIIPADLSTNEGNANDNNAEGSSDIKSLYEYEPSQEAILETLIPQNICVQIFHSMLENSASEQGARMTAMDNASRNAGDMIGRLSLIYNRGRQAAITTELTEIVSGAEAV